MIRQSRFVLRTLSATAVLLILVSSAHAQTGYGVDKGGVLFKFDVNNPNTTAVVIGPTGVNTEAIDFRPSTNTLYAIDVGPNTTQLYTLNINTGAATPVGAGFNSSGVGYDLTGSQKIGFDFNPITLQGDGSMRIRLVSTGGSNLRLNSSTGLIAATDTALAIGTNSPFVDGIAYSNNTANAATGTTTLYDMDSRNDKLYTQNPPNNGTLNEVGAFGLTIDAQSGIGFDIYTPSGGGADQAYAVYTRPDAPIAPGPTGSYLIYNVNVITGATTGGALVMTALNTPPFDFTGGFSVAPGVPEPATAVLFLIGAAGLFALRRRTR